MKGPTARRRAAKAGRLKRAENKHKAEVRDREHHRCRFPLCPCHRFGLFLEVSHKEHKKMGGDPTGERSAPELMILICNWRHKESRYSIDKKTLRWRGLTPYGAEGPIAWEARILELTGDQWVEIASEVWDGERLRVDINDSNAGIFDLLVVELCNRFR